MAILLPRKPTIRKGGLPMKKALSMLLRLVLLIALSILTTGPVLAQTVLGPVRCRTQLVQVGDTKDQILAKCGQPSTADPGTRGGGAVWYYDGSRGNFQGLLRFTGPQLTSIERK